MKRKIKVAVMGSSGYIGRNLTRAVSAGHSDVQIVPVSRDGLDEVYSQYRVFDFLDQYREHYNTESYYDDPDDEYFDIVGSSGADELVDRLQGSDVLVNLSGSGRQSAGNPYHTSVEAPAAVAAFTCKEAGGIPIVHMSGLGASPSVPVAYLASKYAAESIIRNSGLPHVILRPSYVVGRGDHLSLYVMQCAGAGRRSAKTAAAGVRRRTSTTAPPQIDVFDSSRPMQPIHIDDAVSVIMWAVRMLVPAGRRAAGSRSKILLDLVGPDKMPFYDYMSQMARNAGAAARPISMDEAYARALESPESAPFGVDDLGIIAGGYTGNHAKLVRVTRTKPKSITRMLESGGLPQRA